MKKETLYRYNAHTNDFERYYPSLNARIKRWLKLTAIAIAGGVATFALVYYVFDSPTEQNLKAENKELRAQYEVLGKRLESSLSVMEDLKLRDDNFYRVMMQAEPLSRQERYSGLEREEKYNGLQKLSDARLLIGLTQQMDFLERQIVAQSHSYNQLRDSMIMRRDKLDHIPSIIPLNAEVYTLSSGFGKRLDPVYNIADFHEGVDFAAPTGTPVYATASGEVKEIGYDPRYGNYIIIDHGYNYETFFAHLNNFNIEKEAKIERGQQIATIGNTGKSIGSHLHYEVRFKQQPQNPINYYFRDLTPSQYKEMLHKADNSGYVMD